MRLSPWEIALVVLVILIVFGVGKLPQVGEALGKGIHNFKKAASGEEEAKTVKDETKKTV